MSKDAKLHPIRSRQATRLNRSRQLSLTYRRLFLAKIAAAHKAGKLRFFNEQAVLAEAKTFAAVLAGSRRNDWIVYAKKPFAGPEQVLTYLSRYTHRIAISNHRLVGLDDTQVAFTWRDYAHGSHKKIMRLDAYEFLRRFLLHVLPDGFQRIRHYGLLANGHRKAKLATIRKLLVVEAPSPPQQSGSDTPEIVEPTVPAAAPCPCCGRAMTIIEILPGSHRRPPPRFDSS